MARSEKIILRVETWSDELAALLSRLYGADRAQYLGALADAVKRGDAVALVARRNSVAVGVALVAFQKWPSRELLVLAMATAPRSGIDFGRGFIDHIRAEARRAGAAAVRAEARTPANARRLRRLGFRDVSTVMVTPC